MSCASLPRLGPYSKGFLGYSSGMQGLGLKTFHILPCSAEGKNTWNYDSTPNTFLWRDMV
jgi:hypothetical protein